MAHDESRPRWGDGSRTSATKSVPTVGHARDSHRFGQPSSYSLTHAELTTEIRRRRRDGWQSWEIRARFTYGGCRTAA